MRRLHLKLFYLRTRLKREAQGVTAKILGVPVFVVRDGEDLRRTLADLRDKHMVLIDTVGMSQRDRMVAEQAAMLTRSGEVLGTWFGR